SWECLTGRAFGWDEREGGKEEGEKGGRGERERGRRGDCETLGLGDFEKQGMMENGGLKIED
ncbi:MAG: hypothetical protein WB699_06580, partial [Bacteroidota bacterium]